METERADPHSLLHWYKTLATLRRSNAALRDGDLTMLDAGDVDVLAYRRSVAGGTVIVAINMSGVAKKLRFAGGSVPSSAKARTLAASDDALAQVTTLSDVVLPAYTAWVAEIR